MWPPDEAARSEMASALEREEEENDRLKEMLTDLPLSEAQVSECVTKRNTWQKSFDALRSQYLQEVATIAVFTMPKTQDRETRSGFLDECLDLGHQLLALADRRSILSKAYGSEGSDETETNKDQEAKSNAHLESIGRSREEIRHILKSVEISIPDVLADSQAKFTALTESLTPWMEQLDLEDFGVPMTDTAMVK